MIPAPPGITAQYKIDRDGNVDYDTLPVLAFTDEGQALVLGGNSLVLATNYRNFDGLSGGGGEYTALIPSGGWRIEYTDDDGSKSTDPLVGWALTVGGCIEPIITDSDGYAREIDAGAYRICHPSSTGPIAPAPVRGPVKSTDCKIGEHEDCRADGCACSCHQAQVTA